MAKKTENEILESQIGDLGADPSAEAPKDLGHIQHPEVFGGQRNLTPDEQASMDGFLSRARKASDRSREAVERVIIPPDPQEDTPIIEGGWIPVDRREMGERSRFYPEDWEFFIRPATVQAIKNWTAIDEERPDIVNRVFNEIIKSCVKILDGGGQNMGWGSLNSWDRFWFIVKTREYTFAQGESKVEFQDECDQCGEEVTYTLNSKSLFYEFPDQELVDKYWDGEKWSIDPVEYDIDIPPITLYTPKIGKDAAIIEWATARAQQRQKVDEVFVRFLPWMLNKVPKDPQALDRMINKCMKEYKSWDADTFEFMDDVVRNITINPSERLRTVCPHCGGEATSNVQFPDGIKVLFKREGRAKKFGSR